MAVDVFEILTNFAIHSAVITTPGKIFEPKMVTDVFESCCQTNSSTQAHCREIRHKLLLNFSNKLSQPSTFTEHFTSVSPVKLSKLQLVHLKY